MQDKQTLDQEESVHPTQCVCHRNKQWAAETFTPTLELLAGWSQDAGMNYHKSSILNIWWLQEGQIMSRHTNVLWGKWAGEAADKPVNHWEPLQPQLDQNTTFWGNIPMTLRLLVFCASGEHWPTGITFKRGYNMNEKKNQSKRTKRGHLLQANKSLGGQDLTCASIYFTPDCFCFSSCRTGWFIIGAVIHYWLLYLRGFFHCMMLLLLLPFRKGFFHPRGSSCSWQVDCRQA